MHNSYLGNIPFFSGCAVSYHINTAKQLPSFLGRAHLTSEENYTGRSVSLVLAKSQEVRPVLRVCFPGDIPMKITPFRHSQLWGKAKREQKGPRDIFLRGKLAEQRGTGKNRGMLGSSPCLCWILSHRLGAAGL